MLITSDNRSLNEAGTDPDIESINPGVLQLQFTHNLETPPVEKWKEAQYKTESCDLNLPERADPVQRCWPLDGSLECDSLFLSL